MGQWWVGGHQLFVPVPSAVGGFLAEAEVSAEGAAVAEVGGGLVGEEFIGPYQPRYFHSPIMQPMREGTVTAPRRVPGADPFPTFAAARRGRCRLVPLDARVKRG